MRNGVTRLWQRTIFGKLPRLSYQGDYFGLDLLHLSFDDSKFCEQPVP